MYLTDAIKLGGVPWQKVQARSTITTLSVLGVETTSKSRRSSSKASSCGTVTCCRTLGGQPDRGLKARFLSSRQAVSVWTPWILSWPVCFLLRLCGRPSGPSLINSNLRWVDTRPQNLTGLVASWEILDRGSALKSRQGEWVRYCFCVMQICLSWSRRGKSRKVAELGHFGSAMACYSRKVSSGSAAC